MAIELGSVTLAHLTHVEVTERPRLVRHSVPGLGGDIVQDLGRFSVEILLHGSFFGDEGAADLARLREAHRGAKPLDLLAEAVGEGYVARVVVTSVEVAQRVGDIDRFDYECRLTEYVDPPRPPALDPLGAIDSDLLNEATGLVEDVQDAIAQVQRLTALVSVAGFGDPTTRLPALVTSYEQAGGGDSEAAAAVRDLL